MDPFALIVFGLSGLVLVGVALICDLDARKFMRNLFFACIGFIAIAWAYQKHDEVEQDRRHQELCEQTEREEAERVRKQQAKAAADAKVYAIFQDIVKERLRCPATAVFPSEAESMGLFDTAGYCEGYLDAQNGLGALERHRYYVNAWKENGTWKASVRFDH